jgi:hypothetical protein
MEGGGGWRRKRGRLAAGGVIEGDEMASAGGHHDQRGVCVSRRTSPTRTQPRAMPWPCDGALHGELENVR